MAGVGRSSPAMMAGGGWPGLGLVRCGGRLGSLGDGEEEEEVKKRDEKKRKENGKKKKREGERDRDE